MEVEGRERKKRKRGGEERAWRRGGSEKKKEKGRGGARQEGEGRMAHVGGAGPGEGGREGYRIVIL
uniref:Uncharacterized protein n=1 Tax=Oryza sativa subsp. japonica TaxID=39947 RepID=Q5Z6Z6_ORYSJ|nr:hypothetical protein [Oryza sativa Japonica Group]